MLEKAFLVEELKDFPEACERFREVRPALQTRDEVTGFIMHAVDEAFRARNTSNSSFHYNTLRQLAIHAIFAAACIREDPNF